MSDQSRAREEPMVTVLESFVVPHRQANPYNTLLVESLPPQVDAEWFSWRRALTGSFDVFHLHWPEVKLQGSSRPKSLLRAIGFLFLLLRLRVGRRGLVRSLHDLSPHEAPSRLQRWLITLSERWTTVWIILNRDIRPPTSAPAVLAPIGDYRSWFADGPVPPPVPGRLLHFGLVRRYKGIDTLLDAFEQLEEPELTLRIVGAVQDAALHQLLERSAAADARISYVDDYVEDEVLRAEILASELVVLPFARITNSSSLIVALSLDRPVLAPAVGPILEVAEEVGPRWVITYEGSLDAGTIARALEQVRRTPGEGPPDLSARSWDRIGSLHADAFLLARQLVGRP